MYGQVKVCGWGCSRCTRRPPLCVCCCRYFVRKFPRTRLVHVQVSPPPYLQLDVPPTCFDESISRGSWISRRIRYYIHYYYSHTDSYMSTYMLFQSMFCSSSCLSSHMQSLELEAVAAPRGRQHPFSYLALRRPIQPLMLFQ